MTSRRDASHSDAGAVGLPGMLTKPRLRVIVIVVIGMAALVMLVLACPMVDWGRLVIGRLTARELTPAERQARIAALSRKPEPVPDGLNVVSPGGVIQDTQQACVEIDYLICGNPRQPLDLIASVGHCGDIAAFAVDDHPALTTMFSYASLTGKGIPFMFYSDTTLCLAQLPAPGVHLLTLDALPNGHLAHYSWVWTIRP